MLGTRRNRRLRVTLTLLLSLAVHRPAQLPAKVEAARQDRRARPGHVTPKGGAARLIHPGQASGKLPAEREGRGRAEGRKSTDSGAAENKDGPPQPRSACLSPRPQDPEASQQGLVFRPLGDPKSEGGVRGSRLCSTLSLFGCAQARRAHSSTRHWVGVHAVQVHSSPFPAFAKAMPRNPSFHARSPQMEKCLCSSEPSTEQGRTPVLGNSAGLLTRARPCPRAHSSTGIWLASATPGRPAPPMPGKETDAISIADCQTSPDSPSQLWPPLH